MMNLVVSMDIFPVGQLARIGFVTDPLQVSSRMIESNRIESN
jgi:hypothetical protein